MRAVDRELGSCMAKVMHDWTIYQVRVYHFYRSARVCVCDMSRLARHGLSATRVGWGRKSRMLWSRLLASAWPHATIGPG